jgi:hypothetical protein
MLTEFSWFRIEISEHGSRPYSWASRTMAEEGTSSPETLLTFHQSTRLHIPEDSNLELYGF